MFASASEMGYDLCVTLCGDCCNYTYRFEMGTKEERAFRTRRCIVEYRSLVITGRSTRVWEAVEVDPTDETKEIGPPVVLRDVWLDHNASTERDIQSLIFSAIEKFGKGDTSLHFQHFSETMKTLILKLIASGDYKKYFLTIECDYQGIMSKEVAPSAVPTRGLFLKDPVFDSSPTPTSSRDPTRQLELTPSHPTSRMYNSKRQYRLVYKEVCSALHDLNSLGNIFLILSDALIGTLRLVCMHFCCRS